MKVSRQGSRAWMWSCAPDPPHWCLPSLSCKESDVCPGVAMTPARQRCPLGVSAPAGFTERELAPEISESFNPSHFRGVVLRRVRRCEK